MKKPLVVSFLASSRYGVMWPYPSHGNIKIRGLKAFVLVEEFILFSKTTESFNVRVWLG